MLIKTFMILLTTGSGGEVGGAFAAQESMEACESKLPAIVHTIEAADETGKSKVLESGCIAGNWPFEPFSHQSRPEHENAYYLIDFRKADKPVITPMLSKQACTFTKERNSMMLHAKSRKKLYCAASYQGWEKPKPPASHK